MLKEIIIEIFRFLITGGIITSAFVYLSKSITDRFFAHDLEKFKAELEKELTKYKTQFGQLHLEKAQAIKDIFFQFHDIRKALSEMANRITLLALAESKLENRDYLEYDQRVVALREKIQKNSLFFSESLTEEMLRVATAFQCGLEIADIARGQVATDKTSIKHKTDQYFELVKLLNGSVLEPLKKEFKKILGGNL